MGLAYGVLTLAIETSNPSSEPPPGQPGPAVALADVREGGARVLAVEPVSVARAHEDDLASAIERICARAGVRARDLRRVAVSVGPGGFTSVRIAVTTAKMIAEVSGAECVGVPSADVAAWRAKSGVPFGVALASKGRSVYLTLFSAEGVALGPGVIAGPDVVATLEVRRLIADGFLPEEWGRACESRGIVIEAPVFDAGVLAEISARYPALDPAVLMPLYPREPEAVTKWRALHPRSG